MIMRTTARLFTAAVLSLGLLAGCASTEEAVDAGPSAAETAIADAKAAYDDAKATGFAWRDTEKMIKKAEKLLSDGKEDEALALAKKAQKQAMDAQAQAARENQKFLDTGLTSAEAGMASSAAAGMMGGADSYTVERGDSLWSISGKNEIYADPYQWPLIYRANRSIINDADLIYPGQNFDIDRNASSSEIDAAVNHAKTRGAWSVGDVEQSDLDYLNQ